jgi:YjbE family integral membrane protein
MEFIQSIVSIILINVVLSGDNAVVIGMAAHRLTGRQRRWAISVGTLGAIVVRVVLTAIASLLLTIPYLKLVGGGLLLWIAFQLLEDEEQTHLGAVLPDTLRTAIRTIIVADLVMSVDNVLGIAAAAHGDQLLLLVGLALSMPVIMLGGGLIATVLDRFWWLAYAGSGVIAWTSAELMASDPTATELLAAAGLLVEHVDSAGDAIYSPSALGYAIMAMLTVLTLLAAHYVHRYRPVRAQDEAHGE